MENESFQKTVLDGVKAHGEKIDKVAAEIAETKTNHDELVKQVLDIRKTQLAQKTQRIARPGQVSDDCARYLGAMVIQAAFNQGKIAGSALSRAEGLFKDITGEELRTAVAASDIPMPVGYGSEVVELVSMYGTARRFGTVFPLGDGVVKLPRLKTDTAFALIAASAASEVVPQTEWVTFTAEKFGGTVRVPAELEEDSAFAMGQFLARYCARNIAKIEDHNYWVSTGAGSTNNGNVAGIAVSTITNSKVLQQAGTKTKSSDITLANIRAIRSIVDAPAIATGAYYLHPSMEQALSGLNTAGDKPYQANAAQGATLDGFPIRWVDVLPVYSTQAQASKVYALFGDASYQYLGVRGGIRFDTSREAGFTTDEVLVRCLERFTIGLMATGAMSGLETAAS